MVHKPRQLENPVKGMALSDAAGGSPNIDGQVGGTALWNVPLVSWLSYRLVAQTWGPALRWYCLPRRGAVVETALSRCVEVQRARCTLGGSLRASTAGDRRRLRWSAGRLLSHGSKCGCLSVGSVDNFRARRLTLRYIAGCSIRYPLNALVRANGVTGASGGAGARNQELLLGLAQRPHPVRAAHTHWR